MTTIYEELTSFIDDLDVITKSPVISRVLSLSKRKFREGFFVDVKEHFGQHDEERTLYHIKLNNTIN